MVRLLARSAGILLIALGVAAIALAASWSALLPRAADTLAREVGQRTGAHVTLGAIAARLDGQLEIATMTAARGSWTLECRGVALRASVWATLARRPHVRSARIEHCAVSRSPDTAGTASPTDSDHEGLRVPNAESATAAFDRVATWVDAAEVGAIEFEHPRLSARASDLVWSAQQSGASLRGTLSATASGAGTVGASFVVRRSADGLSLQSADEHTIGGVALAFGSAEWSHDAVRLANLSAASDADDRVTVDRLELSGPLRCPRVALDGVRVSPGLSRLPARWRPADPAAAPAPADGSRDAAATEREPEEMTGAVPTRDERADEDPDATQQSAARDAMNAATGRLAELDTWLARLPEPPCVELTVHNALFDLGRHRATVERAVLDTHGVAAVRVRTSNVHGSVSVDLRDLSWAEVTLDGIDINALLGTSAQSATQGEIAVNGRFERIPGQRVGFVGEVGLRGAGFEHPGIAAGPLVGIDASLRTEARLDLGQRPTLTVGFAADVEQVPLTASLRVEPEDDTFAVAFEGGVAAPVPCNRMWRAIPEGMIPNIGQQGVLFAGDAAPRLQVAYLLGRPYSFELQVNEFLAGCSVERIDGDYDPRSFLDDDRVFVVTEGVTAGPIEVGPGTPGWVPIETLPGWVPAAMYLSEEIGFWHNPGISVGLINRAVRLNLDRSRYAYGGSTVTQQLVKNLFLTRTKTLSRKLEEAVIVMAMEQWLPKLRILELYLNCIEFGPNIYGIGAASQYYFGRPPNELTPLEAVFLANLKPSPLSGARHLARGHSPDTGWWVERTAEMLQRLVDYGGFIRQEEVALYAPYVVALTASPQTGAVPYARIARPPELLPPPTKPITAFVVMPD